MSTADKLLEKMWRHPKDWRIEDLERLAGRLGIQVRKHGSGSHVIFYHPKVVTEVSVPAHQPIKLIYIKKFLDLVDGIKD